MIWEFAKSLTAHAKNHFKKVPVLEYKVRMETCIACPHFRDDKRCEKCGCYMPIKAGWRTTACADNPRRWERLDVKGKEGTDTAISD